ncbi:MAG TPA: MBL fold metallo-hydrolase [Candidatus Eisenbergiella merdipullorum]|uniref:MBL fold metallo-hydrolase n=1 Tax=Candidatus Eisenbergiella merdipullorum TaxID=2838553 RepID=A0A9D2I6R3_9FIRM|nr:MBL fold metallo-hydrolase [Candidatus Eisenbergiella merdipullorum]
MSDIKIGRMVLSICQTNCYFLYREGQKDEKGMTEVLLIDTADRGAQIYEALAQKNFHVNAILLTHGHFDHIWGANELRKLSGAKIYAYEGEKEVCEDAEKNVSRQAGRPETVKADFYEKDGAQLTLAGFSLKLIATPGHTQGSCCYYLEKEKVLFSGDTLFQASVGRTDFPTGSMSSLIRSIKEKLLVLPDDVAVYPGHGETTTIGDEKKYNPYCQ